MSVPHPTRGAPLKVLLARSLAGLLWLTVLSAATAEERLGAVHFPVSCQPAAQQAFDRAVALLHSFWFDAALRAFAAVAEADPACGMAHWGIAMTLVAAPPTPAILTEGRSAVERAKAAGAGTERERGYIAAIETFYAEWERVGPAARALRYATAMEALARRYPEDREASVFYALALSAMAPPTDKTYAQQLRAAAILERLFAAEPDHPGVAHYLVHTYDAPPLAQRGLAAARRYAAIAPSVPHALHMPSHIFTRRGLWRESIDSNRASAAAATDHANRLHALDYLVYASLQRGRDREAEQGLQQVAALDQVEAPHFVTAYALAAIPARYALERGRWTEAAALALRPAGFPWSRFPHAEALTVFARGLGAARSGDVAAARRETARLETLRDILGAAEQPYWADQAETQRLMVAGWVAHAEGHPEQARRLLALAAAREDATEKHPVTPGPIVPARELLGELLLELGRPREASTAFETTLRLEPNRFRSLYGLARAAELAGDPETAKTAYGALLRLADQADPGRPELAHAHTLAAR